MAEHSTPIERTAPVAGASYALALLLAINLFNYIDRQVLSAVLPKLKLDATLFRPDDTLVEFKLGLLTTAFILSYMLLSPLFGWLGDKFHRWTLIGVGVILWSLATGGSGLATGFGMLLLTRCFVGIGEAAYGPVAPAMLSDLYPPNHRGRVLSWFYLAIPVGSALGFVIGGAVADTDLKWRGAFLVVVIPGLILGLLSFLMRDPPRPKPTSATPDMHRSSYGSVLRELVRNRSFAYCCAGMTASTFVLGGIATWVPTYIFDREARFTIDATAIEKLSNLRTTADEPVVSPDVIAKLQKVASTDILKAEEVKKLLVKTLSEDEYTISSSWVYDAAPAMGSVTNGEIGFTFGAITVVSGLAATLLGGLLGDWLRNRNVSGAYLKVAGWGTLAGFPCFLGILYAPFPLAWVFIFFTVFALFFNTGPANTVLANVTRSPIRATAFAINILIIHALGDAISPPLIGLIKGQSNFQVAFFLTSLMILVAGGLWVWGAQYLDEDTRKADGVIAG